MKKKITTLNDLHAYLAASRGEEFANGTMQGFEMMCPDRELVWGEQVSVPNEQEPFPEVYYQVRGIIETYDLAHVRKLYIKTPANPKRWEKLIGVEVSVLEELLLSMDGYIKEKKKGYADITLVLNNWLKRRQKPTQHEQRGSDYDNW